MMANGVNTPTAAAPSAYANPSSSASGPWEYGSQASSPWGYVPQTYDPRYGPLFGFDPLFGMPIAANDPRFGFPSIAPRFLPVDPRFGTAGYGYMPRFGLPGFIPGVDPTGLGYDPRLVNRALPQFQGIGYDGQPLTPWGMGGPLRPPEALFAPAPNPMGFGYADLPRFDGMGAQRLRVVGFPGGLPPGVLPRDDEVEEMIHEALDRHPLVPLDAEVDVTCDSGQVTLTGKVPDKRIKRAAGEAAWWIPGVTDVNNTIVVSGRRQAQATRRRGRQQSAPGNR